MHSNWSPRSIEAQHLLAKSYQLDRFSLQSLRTLIQGRQGITWTLGTSIEVTELITMYTEDLLDQGLVDKVISKILSI